MRVEVTVEAGDADPRRLQAQPFELVGDRRAVGDLGRAERRRALALADPAFSLHREVAVFASEQDPGICVGCEDDGSLFATAEVEHVDGVGLGKHDQEVDASLGHAGSDAIPATVVFGEIEVGSLC